MEMPKCTMADLLDERVDENGNELRQPLLRKIHDWLSPHVHKAALDKLGPQLADFASDVTSESLMELTVAGRGVSEVKELLPFAVKIAHNRAASFVRRHIALKRGAGQTIDLPDDDSPEFKPLENVQPIGPEQKERADFWAELRKCLPAKHRGILEDFFFERLSYAELAEKHGIAIGSVGVFLKRALKAAESAAQKDPVLRKKLQEFRGKA